jgi:hypothetical protein
MISNMNKIIALLLISSATTAWSFQSIKPVQNRAMTTSTTTTTALYSEGGKKTFLQKFASMFKESSSEKPSVDAESAGEKLSVYAGNIQKIFPGAMTNIELESKVVAILAKKGFTSDNTLLATSLCCDELARKLEDDFVKIYGNNFNLGGLSGFPFAGNTGFGAMAAHIPDNGSCLVVYGPHVGITKAGEVGKVERAGIKLVDTCCGSAIAASNYLKGITDGGATINTKIKSFTDFQQQAVQELILPHGERLSAAKNRMVELPSALYASQDLLMQDIVLAGAKGIKKNGLALLGGLQINTAPDTYDYFVPLRFDLMNSKGEVVANLLDDLKK